MTKQLIKEAKRLQELAGVLNEQSTLSPISVDSFFEYSDYVILTLSNGKEVRVDASNFKGRKDMYNRFIQLLNTMDTDPRAKQAIDDFARQRTALSTMMDAIKSEFPELVDPNKPEESKMVEMGTEEWEDLVDMAETILPGNSERAIDYLEDALKRLNIELV